MEKDPKDVLSRRRAIGRISALALGAYAAQSFTTLSIARASDSDGDSGSSEPSDGSGPSDGSDVSDVSEASEASEVSEASQCSDSSASEDCDS